DEVAKPILIGWLRVPAGEDQLGVRHLGQDAWHDTDDVIRTLVLQEATQPHDAGLADLARAALRQPFLTDTCRHDDDVLRFEAKRGEFPTPLLRPGYQDGVPVDQRCQPLEELQWRHQEPRVLCREKGGMNL